MSSKIIIDKEALSALGLLKSNLLYPVVELMSEREMSEIHSTGLYKGVSFPTPFLLNPSGKRNQETIKNAKEGDVITLIHDGKEVGTIEVLSSFRVDLESRANQLSATNKERSTVLARMGEYALCGKTHLYENPTIKHIDLVTQKLAHFTPRNVSGVFFNINPLHLGHEHIIRGELERTDVMIIFLLRNYHDDFLDFHTRKRCLEVVLEKYISSERIVVVPLDFTYLFYGDNRHVLYWLIASNYGCTRIIFGPNHPHLGIYFDNDVQHNIFDSLKGVLIDVKILHHIVYCTKCKSILNSKSCPHGRNWHISFKPDLLLNFYKLGLIPPSILVRQEVTSIIYSRILADDESRLEMIRELYYELFPNPGIFGENIINDFYEQTMRLYKL